MSEVVADRQEVAVVYDSSDMRSLYGACRKCRLILVFVASVPLVICLLDYADAPDLASFSMEMSASLALGALLAGAVYFFSPALQHWQRRKSGWDRPMMVHFTDAGIATRHPNQDAQFHWSAIKDVVNRKGRLFLFTTPNCAIILPRRCFDSDVQFDYWVGQATKYFGVIQSAKVDL